MKKKILLMLSMIAVLALVLAFTVSAESVHSGRIDPDATVTVDGQELALFDAEGNALIWYLDSTGALKSIRADIGIKGDDKVDFQINGWANYLNGVMANQVDAIVITANGETYGASSIVVLNIMDDDVLVTTCASSNNIKTTPGAPVNCFATLFSGSTNLQYAYLRLDTTAIQGTTFKNASNLKYINLADLTELLQIGGGQVFNGCKSLFNGEVLDLTGTKLIHLNGDGLFNAVPFTGIMLPESLKTIGGWCFQGTGLTSFTFPTASVTINGDSHFKDCKSLTTVTGLENLTFTKVPNKMFYGCEALTSVAIPSTVTEIGDNAFQNCKALTSINLPSGLVKIGSNAFNGCSFLGDVDLPNGITTINAGAFNGCSSFTKIHIPSSVTYIGSDCWRNCTNVTSITFDPDCNITHLYAHTFDSTKATTVTVPNTVQHIGQNCFKSSTLVSLNLGASFVDFNASNAGQPPIGAAGTLKYLYLSSTFTADALRNNILNWGDVPSNKNELKTNYVALTVFYTGTKEAAEAIIAKAQTGGTDGAPLNEYFGSMILISAADYEKAVADETLVEGEKNAPVRYFVYGYNHCEAFYEGKHTMSGNAEMQFNGYLEDITFADTCTRENCGLGVIDDSKTIGAVFVSLGYSYTEVAIGGSYSMAQFFGVDKENLQKYEELMDTTLSFGIVAAGNKGAGVIKPFESEKFISHDFTNNARNYFEVKITGIDEDNLNTKLVFCAYVIENGKISYLNNKQTVEDLTGESYYDVEAIKKAEQGK